MNLNIYIEDNLGKEVAHIAKRLGKSRNRVVREALKEWVTRYSQKKWPTSIMKFQGVEDFPRFESYRDEMQPPKEDPLE